ncbi:MAG: UDP-N-acetylmuramoyl-L-alanyl-D-glutamate--2,6-diaminopimelate ligase [Bdellovibrionia bacterium]
MYSMRLQDLFNGIAEIPNEWQNYEVLSVVQDARQAKAGALFIAIPGTKVDGHSFIPQALQGGAQIFVVQNKSSNVPKDSLQIQVQDSRQTLDLLASRFYQAPSQKMLCVGITGTNGKTSTSYMLEHLFNAGQKNTGVIGTINHHYLTHVWESQMTTPDPLNLQKRLQEFVQLGAKAVAMEVSSHALDQKRANSVDFDAAIFTNLTRDHLDYHASMEAYFLAKALLFSDLLEKSPKKNKLAVINGDDEWGQKISKIKSAPTKYFGFKPENEFQIVLGSSNFTHTEFQLKYKNEIIDFKLPMIGEHNVLNIVGALVCCHHFGQSWSELQQAVQSFNGVPGRLQWVQNNQQRPVFVDYAHTPDALENVLNSIRKVRSLRGASNKIWTVFGCGGDRDKGKRPLMAQIAEKLSDFVMVTSDNPRTENPADIIKDILAGFSDPKSEKVTQEGDRSVAIQKVMNLAQPEDVILIAGKGHEDYQIIGSEKKFFSDYLEAKKNLGD